MEAFRLLGLLLPKDQRKQLKDLQREHRRITEIVDTFYALLGERSWVFTGDLNLPAIEQVIDSKDPATAESRLIDYYKSADRITFPLRRLHRFEAMRPRIDLLQKALTDYEAGRYYGTVLVLLSVMDGFVNDLDTATRQGLHARPVEDMVAWDSVAGHHLGLSHAHQSFVKGFYRTDTAEVTELFRNGIMHGTLVNFDNEVVATAKKYRLHVQTVRKRLIEAGIDTRARLRVLADEDLRAARAAKGDRASFREIARGLGVAHTTVTRSLARRDEAPKSPSRTTKVGLRTSSVSVRARRSPLRTTSETPFDQGKREMQTGPSIEMLGPDPGYLRSRFSNSSPQANTLVTRWYRGVYRESRRTADHSMGDLRGPVVREVETAQTFLTASEVDRLVADYQAGVGVLELADRYGVHRTTVAAHLRRRNMPRRSTALDVNERAEAARLYRAGVSLRVIGRRLGVDRKTVRAVMITAGVTIRKGRGLDASPHWPDSRRPMETPFSRGVTCCDVGGKSATLRLVVVSGG